MKFLFVTSLKRELVKVWVCQETSPVGSLLPPVDLASIAATVRKRGCTAEILDLRLFNDPKKTFLQRLQDFKPDGVILNISTTSANTDYELISLIPNDIRKICFGTHAQSLPEECFDKGVDYILVGDPEICISDLLENEMDASKCKGILVSSGCNHASEVKPNYCSNLDLLPFPALDLLELHKYYAPYINHGNLFSLLLSSRGCTYKCDYCLYPTLFGGKFRTRSPKNIVDEMEYDYKRYGIREFIFLDATFNISEKRVVELCTEIIKRKLQIIWACNMRVTPVSLEMLSLMKRAGCNRVFYGVEDTDLLEETGKGVTEESIKETFRKTKESDISTVAFTMLFPREDITEEGYEKKILSTLTFLGADAFQCNVAIPFPGTDMFNKLQRQENLSRDWSLYDPHGNRLPYETKVDLISVKRGIYTKFLFWNPWTVISLLRAVNFKAFKAMVFTFIKVHLPFYNR